VTGADGGTVFVTGATGTLGRPVLRRLAAAGWRVRALARRDADRPRLEEQGVEPVRGDLFDPETLGRGTDGCHAVLHLATRIPPGRDATRLASWRENDRIRIDGTRLLVDTAVAAGVRRFVYPSVCLVYPDRGDAWIDERVPAGPDSRILASTLTAEREVARFDRGAGAGLVLRMGAFYGPDAPSTRETLAMARRGIAGVLGPRHAYTSPIWVDDAAAAVVAALGAVPGGLYNVVDDEPQPRGLLADAMAAAVGRRRLFVPLACWSAGWPAATCCR